MSVNLFRMPKDVLAQVAYDGELLAEGSMDVKDFAPALLALGEVIQEANRVLNGDRARIEVHVESRFRPGSFGLTLGLAFTAYQGFASVFGPNPIKTAQDIAEFEKKDLLSFDVPIPAWTVDKEAVSERPALLEVLKPSFSQDLKWVFSDGSTKFSADVADTAFLDKVQSGQRTSAKGDVLRVRMRSTPHLTGDGLRTEHVVLRVLEEFNAARQIGLLPSPSPDEE